MAARWSLVVLVALIAVASGHKDSTPAPPAEKEHDEPAPTPAPASAEQPAVPLNVEPGAATSISQAIGGAIDKRLRSGEYQWINALVALVVGIVMVYDGEKSFKYFVVFAVFLVTYMLVMTELQAKWPDMKNMLQMVFATEAALYVAYSTYKGYEGLQLFLGLILAAILAYYAHDILRRDVSADLADNDVMVFLLVNFALVLGVYAIKGKVCRQGKITPLAIVSSWVGGCLITTAVAYFEMYVAVLRKDILEKSFKIGLPDSPPPWVAFFKMMVVPGSEMVGVWIHSPYNFKVGGYMVHIDYLQGYVLWAIFFVLGISLQKTAAFCGSKKQKGKPTDDATQTARQSLEQPLVAAP